MSAVVSCKLLDPKSIDVIPSSIVIVYTRTCVVVDVKVVLVRWVALFLLVPFRVGFGVRLSALLFAQLRFIDFKSKYVEISVL